MKRERLCAVFAICTGCHKTVLPGPYFQRRIRRHLNDGQHNHDAVEAVVASSRAVNSVVNDYELQADYAAYRANLSMGPACP